MGACLQRLIHSHIPLVEVETNGACSSQCCDELISEATSSSSSSDPSRPPLRSAGSMTNDPEDKCNIVTDMILRA